MKLSRANLAALAFCSKDETRFNLQAMLVGPDGTVATDGHRLIWIGLPKTEGQEKCPPLDGSTKRTFLPLRIAKRVFSLLPKPRKIGGYMEEAVGATAEVTGDMTGYLVSVQMADPEWQDERVQLSGQYARGPTGKPEAIDFPDWRVVMPEWGSNTGPVVGRAGINLSYLAEIGKIANDLGCKPGGMIELHAHPYAPLSLKTFTHSGQPVRIVVMGMRLADDFAAKWERAARDAGYFDRPLPAENQEKKPEKPPKKAASAGARRKATNRLSSCS